MKKIVEFINDLKPIIFILIFAMSIYSSSLFRTSLFCDGLIATGIVLLQSILFMYVTQDKIDAKMNIVMWFFCNLGYWYNILKYWDGSDWYYYSVLIFVLAFNVMFFLRCIYFNGSNFYWYCTYVALIYFSTIGILEIAYVYTDLNSMCWHAALANALRTIGTGFVASNVIAIFVKKRID